MNQCVEIIVRSILAFLWLLVYTKMIGRRLIAHSAYHLFVLSAVLGTIGGNMAFNVKVELKYFLLSLLIISGIGYALMKLSLASAKAGAIIAGGPVVMIRDGSVLKENMLKCNYSLDALKQALRSKDIFNLEEVEYAVLEINGSLSVLKKKEYRSVTVMELKSYFPDKAK